jgi:hypothetical protein
MNIISEHAGIATLKNAGKYYSKFISLFDNSSRPPMECVSSFALLCQAAGVQENDYSIPDQGTAKQKADAYWKRLMLQEQVFNEGWIPSIVDIKQKKWSAWANIIPDASRPFGFRLTCSDFACDDSCSTLGARPEFKSKPIARYAFETFTSDYEGFLYYTNLSKQKKS